VAGKGDKPRPCNFKKYQSNYEDIFGTKEQTTFEWLVTNAVKYRNETNNIQRPESNSEDK
jgi:hypothetical protein